MPSGYSTYHNSVIDKTTASIPSQLYFELYAHSSFSDLMKKITLLLIVSTIFGCHRNEILNTDTRVGRGPEMITLKHFGLMDCSDDPTTIWQKFATINDQKFPLELNYPRHAKKKSLFLKNECTLDSLETIIQKSSKELIRDYNNKGTTRTYIELHLEGFEKEDYDFHKIDDIQNQDKNETIVLNKIVLRRVGIFLVDSINHVVLTYGILNKELYFSTEQLVMKYDKKYDLTGIITQN